MEHESSAARVPEDYRSASSSADEEANRSVETCEGSSLFSDSSSDADINAQNSDRLAVTSSSGSSDNNNSVRTSGIADGPAALADSAESGAADGVLGGARGRRGSHTRKADSKAGAGPSASGAAAAEDEGDDSATMPTAVGLINEGCTCYLNSLLQLLFHLSYFRTAVYRIPVDGDEGPTVYKALQETFFQMQERTTPARTTVLTDAFGWGRKELYVQHDIQEMATLLRDNLEERMKGTVTEGAINQLFEGRGEQFVETLDKSYVSRRADTYYDVHIPLGQHNTLLGSLTSLTARDQLIGDNKYRVEREGMPVVYMDAEKGYSYTRFPPVTWFHLKRFAMDLTSPTLEMRKVNAPLEFPVELDLRSLEKPQAEAAPATADTTTATASGAEEAGAAAAATAGAAGEESAGSATKVGSAVVPFSVDSPAIYDLQGVIVHRGTARSGHYICYIREWDPAESRFSRWLEYDDESVRQVPEEVAVRANYGRGANAVDSFRHDTSLLGGANAYILSYVRRADAATILAPSPTDIVSARVKEAMRRAIQEEERQLREAEEARMSVTMYCVTDAAIGSYCDTVCDTELFTRDAQLWRRFAECVVTVRKSDTLAAVYETLSSQQEMARRGVTAHNCRLWRCTEGSALRPAIPLPTCAENVERRGLGPEQAQECLKDFLTAEENNTALVMCVYVDQAKPLLPGLRGVSREVGLIRSVLPDASGRCYTVELTHPIEAGALHITLDHCDYAATVEYVVTTDKETLPAAMVSVTDGDNAVTLQLSEARRTSSVMLTCHVSKRRTLAVRDVHLELPFDHPLLQPAPAESTSALPVLPLIGYDRTLLFFKFFDNVSGTIQYVGSRLIEKAAKLYCCGAVYRDFLGIPEEVAPVQVPPPVPAPSSAGAGSAGNTPGSSATSRPHAAAAPPPSMFRFFVERGDHTVMELNEHFDLAEWKCGSVVVAQRRDVQAPQRYLSVHNYYHDVRNSRDVQVIEVQRSHRANDEAYQHATLDRQRIAVAAAAKAAAAAAAAAAATTAAAAGSAKLPNGAVDAEAAITGAPALNTDAGTSTAKAGAAPAPSSADTPKALTPSPSGAVASTPTAGLSSSALEADPLRAAASLNPFEAVQLPTLHEMVVTPLPTEHTCRMLFSWNYEAVCAAIGRVAAVDGSRLQLYQSASATEPAPEASPAPYSSRVTVADLLYLDSYNPCSVLYYERMAEAREAQQSTGTVTVTLRDRAGYALHRETFTVGLASITRQALARLVCHSIPAWQREADPWGSVEATVQSPHFTLSYVDPVRHAIAAVYEVAMSKTGADESALDAGALRKFDVDIQAAAPLQGTEQRIACCHMHYSMHDRSAAAGQQHLRSAYGQPFVITVDRSTTVREALELMLRATRLPREALNNSEGFGVMMMAGQVYHFENWDEHVYLFWVHTKNTSQYVASLVLNHVKPRGKPGSRYVAQHNPQLKISNK